LGGPLVELNFYWRGVHTMDAMRMVVMDCLNNGAQLCPTACIVEGPLVRSQAYHGRYDDPGKVVNVSEHGLEDLFCDPAVRILTIDLYNAIGLVAGVLESVEPTTCSEEAIALDSHSIAIVGEGQFCECFEDDLTQTSDYAERKQAGLKCYRTFVRICQETDPDYAAILVEDYLPCWTDLRRGDGKRAFHDFYVSRGTLGDRAITDIRNMSRGAYVEELDTGLYVSTFELLNPRQASLPDEQSHWLSSEVANLISSLDYLE
jgi:hypothetical protein